MHPLYLKGILNQVPLKTLSYETLVQYLEREIETNELATTDDMSLTGREKPTIPTRQNTRDSRGLCYGGGNNGHLRNFLRSTNMDEKNPAVLNHD